MGLAPSPKFWVPVTLLLESLALLSIPQVPESVQRRIQARYKIAVKVIVKFIRKEI
jgi:hypothetical protein